MSEQIAAVESPGRRAAGYWFADGLPELVFGAVNLLAGVFGVLSRIFVATAWFKWAYVAAVTCFMVLLCKDRAILDLIKARLTYPRTGYVRPPRDATPDQNGLLVRVLEGGLPPVDENVSWFKMRSVFVFFLAGQFLPLFDSSGRWLIAPIMAAAAVWVWWGVQDEVHHYSPLAVAPIALAGVAAAFLDLPGRAWSSVPMVIGGLWLVAAGIYTRIGYLRANPAPPATERQ
jgi:hypothetical protein